MKQLPDACDRTYQHTGYGLFLPMTDTSSGETYNFEHGTRSWFHDYDAGRNTLKLCDMAIPNGMISGFLQPYAPNQDTLLNVPTEIVRCRDIEVCPDYRFVVDHKAVHTRMVLAVVANPRDSYQVTFTGQLDSPQSRTFRPYTTKDASVCFGFGYLVKESQNTEEALKWCVVDRYAVPWIDVVFGDAALGRHVDIDTFDTPSINQAPRWSSVQLEQKFNNLLAHCPHAFEQSQNQFDDFFRTLTRPYNANDKKVVLQKVNQIAERVFGLEGVLLRRRGFTSVDEYLVHANCMKYVAERLAIVRQLAALEQPYNVESIQDPIIPGDTIYLFMQRAPVLLPLDWLWQCVVVSDADQGGAPRNVDSFLSVAASTNIDSISCSNYKKQVSASTRLSLRERLQQAPFVFTTQRHGPPLANLCRH